jgi:hypothetical protein
MIYIQRITLLMDGRDNAVGIATHYVLDDPGFEPRWEEILFRAIHTGPRSIQPPLQWLTGLFPGSKAAGSGSDPSPPFWKRDIICVGSTTPPNTFSAYWYVTFTPLIISKTNCIWTH